MKNAIGMIGQKVMIAGWVNVRRDHGKIIFIDLRDVSGILQVVFIPNNKKLYEIAETLRPEWVVSIIGIVNKRPEKMINKNIETGEVEMLAEEIQILSEARTLPFPIDNNGYELNEELRLKYRYLDLRRERMLKNLRLRHEVKNFARRFLTDRGFIEIDTPILTKSTPEGARDFLVPSRHHPGKFYALPQSPQQYKQLLMVAGVDKYFQFPRCFRDEDLRADRLLEFDQLDIEMSFINQEDILKITEELVADIIEKVIKKKIQEKPFPRITHKTAMEKYGNDKPDFRKDKKNDNLIALEWVVDFPMFEKKDDGAWGAAHHPFTAPYEEDLKLMEDGCLDKVRAHQYDLVLNGNEVFGGSIRTFKPDILKKVFEALGHSRKEIENKFGHLLGAFEYGVPPHGGIAGGFDRFLMAALGEKNIREVIPFPTTSVGTTAIMDAPSEVDKEQLEELGIKIIK